MTKLLLVVFLFLGACSPREYPIDEVWEPIAFSTERMQVPGGWLIRSRAYGRDSSFVPDPGHLWLKEEK